ncbi:type II toxin-antitoxin system VapC family toxin [Fibrella aquatilis]|uniref:Type II toxin-antitoxin system VapC family toxin n=1 Tax=Fibrella aquatilis TaxID=2817059 RepID=A0A939G833_9BACT|nr:type II toxin-antitoxin system VapC family toxin [Fibrella aquatilis]MBO0932100.1 type II toxin-antitoxin system VapC family toxin [Fibrella aquatilis]
MKLLDTNILIYSAQPEYQHLQELYKEVGVSVSEMTRLEVLGFSGLTEEQETFFNAVFSIVRIIPVSQEIIDKAITFRRAKNMKVGDAIIAATAAVNNLELITRNEKDFKHIAEITMTNPIPAAA